MDDSLGLRLRSYRGEGTGALATIGFVDHTAHSEKGRVQVHGRKCQMLDVLLLRTEANHSLWYGVH